MKSMMMAVCAIALIGVGAYFALHELGFSSQAVYSGTAVRLD